MNDVCLGAYETLYGFVKQICTYESSQNFSKDDVFAVHPSGLDHRDEELRSIRVLSFVCHGNHSRGTMAEDEVLVVELLSEDAGAWKARDGINKGNTLEAKLKRTRLNDEQGLLGN